MAGEHKCNGIVKLYSGFKYDDKQIIPCSAWYPKSRYHSWYLVGLLYFLG